MVGEAELIVACSEYLLPSDFCLLTSPSSAQTELRPTGSFALPIEFLAS